VGAPYFGYAADASDVDQMFALLVAADALNYIMAAGTDGGGND